MKIFYNETCANFKVAAEMTDDKRFVVHVCRAGDDDTEIGAHGIPLKGHNTYTLLYRADGFRVRDRENKQYVSKIKLVPTLQITMGSRMKLEEVENRYDAYAILQVDTNTISGDVFEAQAQLFRVARENFSITLPDGAEAEYIPMTNSEIFTQGAKRHKFWDTYSLTIGETEYKGAERGEGKMGEVATSDDGYTEMQVEKYTTSFGEKLTRDADDEEVFIECTGGIANCQRVKLMNGKGRFRWYPMGFAGDFKIKLGWRWYSGVAEVRLEAK